MQFTHQEISSLDFKDVEYTFATDDWPETIKNRGIQPGDFVIKLFPKDSSLGFFDFPDAWRNLVGVDDKLRSAGREAQERMDNFFRDGIDNLYKGEPIDSHGQTLEESIKRKSIHQQIMEDRKLLHQSPIIGAKQQVSDFFPGLVYSQKTGSTDNSQKVEKKGPYYAFCIRDYTNNQTYSEALNNDFTSKGQKKQLEKIRRAQLSLMERMDTPSLAFAIKSNIITRILDNAENQANRARANHHQNNPSTSKPRINAWRAGLLLERGKVNHER